MCVHDIESHPGFPLVDGTYEIQAVLLTDPGSVQIQQTAVSVTVKN